MWRSQVLHGYPHNSAGTFDYYYGKANEIVWVVITVMSLIIQT